MDELVAKTVCDNVTRDCMKRCCDGCGVSSFMDVLRKEVSDHLEKICEWKRWEKTDISRKDLVTKSGTLNELLDHLTSDLSLMAKHLKVAHWQRTQYQKLKESLPPNHCILTILQRTIFVNTSKRCRVPTVHTDRSLCTLAFFFLQMSQAVLSPYCDRLQSLFD